MTVATQGNNSMAEFGDDIGLEDLDATDLTLPRIQIIHAQGMFAQRAFETPSAVDHLAVLHRHCSESY